jgi:2-oxoglutarate ferredoxin oxidoreductase subunit delta
MKLWRKAFDEMEKAAKPGRVLIDKERCKGCGYCVEFCPRGALKMSDRLSPQGYNLPMVADKCECLSCGLCEILCPEFAIHVVLVAQRAEEAKKE